VRAPLSTDLDAIDALDETFTLGGELPPLEALRQLATGIGLDVDCDGIYDPLVDLAPWNSRAGDLFDGTAPSRSAAEGTVGERGGFGFRIHARPVFVVTGLFGIDPGAKPSDPADPINHPQFRLSREPPYKPDPDGVNTLNDPPEVCPPAATMADAVAALQALDATVLVATDVPRYTYGRDNHAFAYRLLEAGGWEADLDDDGEVEPLLLDLSRHRPDGSTRDWALLRGDMDAAVGAALEQLKHEIRFDRLTLEVEGDDAGFIARVDPQIVTSIDADGKAQFRVLFRGVVPAQADDRVYRIALNVVADGRDRVARQEILIVVPGRDAP
jgi:hypothetical protein